MKNDRLLLSVKNARKIAIAGHVRPDGDCIGSTLALYNYIRDNYENINVDLYLESVPECYDILKNWDSCKNEYDGKSDYDLFIILDTSTKDRIGAAGDIMEHAATTMLIDHHISCEKFADINIVEPYASSACEVLFCLLDEKKISKEAASCLFTGIVTDTGCFRHNSTKLRTMEIAGRLIDKGVRNDEIIDRIFNERSYVQTLLLGKCLEKSVLHYDGKYITSVITQKMMKEIGAVSSDIEGIVNELLSVRGVEVAILFTETGMNAYKVSLRSKGIVDVNAIAACFGGGGHILASGAHAEGFIENIVNEMTDMCEKQVNK